MWRVAGLIGVAGDVLARAVELVLLQAESMRDGRSTAQASGELVIVSGRAPSQTATGMGMAILAFHLGGVPAAALAALLARRTRRRRPWIGPAAAACFRVGFVLQAGCALAAVMLFGLFGGLLTYEAGSLAELAAIAPEIVLLALWCLPHAFVSVWALRFWRELQSAANAASHVRLLHV